MQFPFVCKSEEYATRSDNEVSVFQYKILKTSGLHIKGVWMGLEQTARMLRSETVIKQRHETRKKTGESFQ